MRVGLKASDRVGRLTSTSDMPDMATAGRASWGAARTAMPVVGAKADADATKVRNICVTESMIVGDRGDFGELARAREGREV